MSKKLEQPISDKQLEKILDSMVEPIFIIDWKGKMLFVNKAMAKMSGYKKKEIIGKNGLEFAHPDSKKDIIKDLLTVKKKGGGFIAKYKLIKKNGDIVWVESIGDKIMYQGKERTLTTFRNITKRVIAEQKAKESENNFKNIVENSYEVFFTGNTKGTITYISPAVERLSGFKPDEVIGKNFIKYFTKSSLFNARKAFMKLLKGTQIKNIELEMKRKNGTSFFAELNATPIIKNGKIIGVQGSHHDISEKKETEEKIKNNEKKYKSIFDASPEAIVLLDNKGRVLDVNKRVDEWLGWKIEDIKNKNLLKLNFLTRESKLIALQKLTETLVGKDPEPYELDFINKKGRVRVGLVKGSPIYNEKGKIIQDMVMISDITEREEAEKKIKEAEKKYRTWIDQAGDAFYMLDLKGNYVYSNKKGEELSGYKVSERKGKNLLSIVPISEYLKLAPVIKDLLLHPDKKQSLTETEIIRPDGTRIPIESRMTPYYIDGKLKGFMGMSRDISERKKAEKKLLDQEKKYRYLFENSLNLLIGVNKQGKIIEANEVALKAFGYKKEDVLGKSFRKFIPLKYIPRLLKDIALELAGQKTEGIIMEIKNKKGNLIPVEFFSGSIPLYKDNKQIGLMVSGRDISMSELAKKKISEAEASYKTIFDSSNDALFVHDSKTGQILDINKRTEELFGYSKEKIKKMNIGDISSNIPPYTQKEAKQFIKKATQGKPQLFEWQIKNKKGEIVWVETSLKQTTIKGEKRVLASMRDITQRKVAEEKIKKEKEKAEQYLNIVGNIIVALDKKGNITLLNKKGYSLLGYAEGKLFGKNWFDIAISKIEVSKIKKIHANNMNASTPISEKYENSIISKDGSEHIIRWQNTLIKNEAGEIVGTLSSGEDITEEKRAQEKVKESEIKFQTLVENIPNAVYTALPDKDGTVTFMSPQWGVWSGYYPKDFYKDKTTWKKSVYPDDLKIAEAKFAEAIKNKKAYSFEYRLKHKTTGKITYILDQGKPIIKNGKLTAYNGIASDITARKKAEKKIKESEASLRDLFEGAIDIIHVINNQGKITYANQTEMAKLGYSKKELIGKKSIELIHPDFREATKKELGRVMSGEELKAYKSVFITKSGETIDVEINATPRIENGKVIEVRAIIRDITAKRKAEKELKDKLVELEEINKLMVGRELRMVELKKKVEELEKRLK